MSDAIAFYADEHFPGPVSLGLRRRGIEILTTHEAGRAGTSDPDQLAFASSQERVIVTFDTDYLMLHQLGIQHSGIAWCPEQKYNIGELIQALQLLRGVLDRESMRNHVEYL